nr:MAG TPA: hypothetical protein [Caudoviricetes sp.]
MTEKRLENKVLFSCLNLVQIFPYTMIKLY